MNKFAQMTVKTRGGLDMNVVVTCNQMAAVGIQMGWIVPIGPAGMKMASGLQPPRKTLVKLAAGTRKVKMSVTSWTKMAMDNGWIVYDPITKVAGFFSALGDMAGSAVNAVGNAWQGTKDAFTGAAQFGRDQAGRVIDAAGRAVNATVNAAGQVVDATGRVIGQVGDAAAAGAQTAARGVQQYGRDMAHGAKIVGNAASAGAEGVARGVGQANRAMAYGAGALGGAAVNAVQSGMQFNAAARQFMMDQAGRVLDAGGRVVNATVNAAGQVVDATGRVIGQAANYVGQVAGQAVKDVQQGYTDRRSAGGTNFLGANGQMVAASPVGAAGRAVGQVANGIAQAGAGAVRDVQQGYAARRAAGR